MTDKKTRIKKDMCVEVALSLSPNAEQLLSALNGNLAEIRRSIARFVQLIEEDATICKKKEQLEDHDDPEDEIIGP